MTRVCYNHADHLRYDLQRLLSADQDPEEKEAQKELEEKFQPLVSYLKMEASNVVRNGKPRGNLIFRG